MSLTPHPLHTQRYIEFEISQVLKKRTMPMHSLVLPEGEIQEEQVRAIAASRLHQLRQESLQVVRPGWVHPENNAPRADAARFFDYAGFVHVPSFVAHSVVQSMKEEMAQLVATQWDVTAFMDSFGTDTEQNVARGRYFLESASRIHFFAEPEALDDSNKKKQSRTCVASAPAQCL
jgi:hypothetical protein